MYTYDADIDDVDLAAPRRNLPPRQIPRDLQGVSPNLTHWLQVANIYRSLRSWFPHLPKNAVRVDKNRREYGRPASRRRPDIQFRHPDRHRATHIEVDTERAGMEQHMAHSDPRRRRVFVLIDRNTGAVIEKRICAPGARKAIVRYGPVSPRDVFDEFDAAADDVDWDTPRRWACKAGWAFPWYPNNARRGHEQHQSVR